MCIELMRQITIKDILKHVAIYSDNFSQKIVCIDDDKFDEELVACDGDINNFADTMLEEYKQCMDLLNKHFNKEIIMRDQTNFISTTELINSVKKNLLFIHISGNYRCTSCKSCNKKLGLSINI